MATEICDVKPESQIRTSLEIYPIFWEISENNFNPSQLHSFDMKLGMSSAESLVQTPRPSYCHLGAAFIWSALVWGGKARSGARSLEEKNIIVSIE